MMINGEISMQPVRALENTAGKTFTLGSFLFTIREMKAMTQIQFSKMLGISKQNLCDIEHGRRFISPKIAARFAEKLGYGMEQFVKLALQALVDRDGVAVRVDVEVV